MDDRKENVIISIVILGVTVGGVLLLETGVLHTIGLVIFGIGIFAMPVHIIDCYNKSKKKDAQ